MEISPTSPTEDAYFHLLTDIFNTVTDGADTSDLLPVMFGLQSKGVAGASHGVLEVLQPDCLAAFLLVDFHVWSKQSHDIVRVVTDVESNVWFRVSTGDNTFEFPVLVREIFQRCCQSRNSAYEISMNIHGIKTFSIGNIRAETMLKKSR